MGTCQTDFAVHDHEGTDSTVARPLTYRPDIDGLRALAVLLVVAFHAFPEELPWGFVGVDVFFVISGYLITGLVAAEIKAGSFSVLGFYARCIRKNTALRAAVEASGGAYVSLMDILCNAEGCLASVPGLPGTLLTWDYGHLTTAGAELIARRMQGMGLLDVGGPSAGR